MFKKTDNFSLLKLEWYSWNIRVLLVNASVSLYLINWNMIFKWK